MTVDCKSLSLILVAVSGVLGCSHREQRATTVSESGGIGNPVAPAKATTVEPSIGGDKPITEIAPDQAITADDAMHIVRGLIKKKTTPGLVPVLDAQPIEGGFRVYVRMESGRDARGELVHPAIGSHSLYEISRRGEVTRVIRGL